VNGQINGICFASSGHRSSMYNVYRFASIAIPALPHWFVMALAKIIGLTVWLFARNTRKQATTNAVHVLGPHVQKTRAGRRLLRRTVQGMFQHNARNYMDVFSLPRLQPETVLRSMNIDGFEHLDEALALGKGAILFTAHFGPFNYMVQGFPAKGYQVTIPVEQLKDQRLLDLMLKLRRSQGINFVSLGDRSFMRSIIGALWKNQIVLLVADRAVQGESVEKPFFDSIARLPLGPVLLAQRTGAPLVGGFGWYTSHASMQVQFVPLSLELERADTDALMCGLIKIMERFIKAHPEQWLMFSAVWKDGPPAQLRV
jgi:phosphatidylinositol dimannoside acyltransferase